MQKLEHRLMSLYFNAASTWWVGNVGKLKKYQKSGSVYSCGGLTDCGHFLTVFQVCFSDWIGWESMHLAVWLCLVKTTTIQSVVCGCGVAMNLLSQFVSLYISPLCQPFCLSCCFLLMAWTSTEHFRFFLSFLSVRIVPFINDTVMLCWLIVVLMAFAVTRYVS